MSETRNPTYFVGDLRRSILDSAAEVIARDGPAAVSLREIARRIGVSHAAPAHHFRDKTGLFTALAADGWARFVAATTEARDGADSPVAKLAATGVAYVVFARDNPGYFRVMFRHDLVDASDPAFAEGSKAGFDVLSGVVDACRALGWGRAEEPWVLITSAWSLVHGLADLASNGSLGFISGDRPADEIARYVTDAFAAAFTT
ncbi:MAG: TetR/AcrR family transcriptional regulator [Frankia sp.]